MGEEILIFITKPFRECGVSSKNYFQCQLIKPKCILKVVPFYAILSDGSGILFWITHPTKPSLISVQSTIPLMDLGYPTKNKNWVYFKKSHNITM